MNSNPDLMNCNFLRKLASATCAMLLLFSAATVQAAQRLVSDNIPGLVAKLGLSPVQELPSTKRINLAISLPVRDSAGLNLLVQQVSDPASTNYQKYLTTAEFAEPIINPDASTES